PITFTATNTAGSVNQNFTLTVSQASPILIVNSLADNTIAGDGLVTLREAILASTNHTTDDLGQIGTGNDTIQFASSLTAGGSATITLSIVGDASSEGNSALMVTTALSIQGPNGANGIT